MTGSSLVLSDIPRALEWQVAYRINQAQQWLTHRRALFLIGAMSGAAVFGATLMQWLGGIEPCPLCIAQRTVFLLIALIALPACALRPCRQRNRLFLLSLSPLSLAGLVIAARHAWIQSPWGGVGGSCGPGMSYLMDTLPLWEAIVSLARGTGDCASVSPVLGVPLPLWSALGFLLIGAIFTLSLTRKAAL